MFRSLLLIPFIYFITDLIVRFKLLQLFSAKQLLFYGISIITSSLLFVFVILLISSLKKRKFVFNLLLSLFSIYLVLTVFGSYIFFYFNGFFPNFYTLEYFKNEPLSAFILLQDTIKLMDVTIFLIGFILVFILLRLQARKEYSFNSTGFLLGTFVIYICCLTFLAIKIKKYDQCLIVDSNFSAAVSRHVFDWESNREFKGKGLGERNPIRLKKSNEKRNFNVLIIVCESLRKQNLGVYGYSRNTTPFIGLFQKEHPDEFFVFKNPYTVSTTTMLAVPGVLTGIGPYQSTEIFYSQPIVWDYGKMLNYRTFFLSSHSLRWYRFDRFYSKEKLDHFWYMEKSGFPLFNDLGIDDSHTINHLNTLMREKNENPFFALIQLNSTHYPYRINKKFAKWKGSFVDEYDNSILYQDFVLGKIFRELKKNGKLENTVIILTSDHGESLKDHNNIGHVDSYYAETVSVPLMIYLPEKVSRNLDLQMLRNNLNKTVSNIDIAPTIIDLLGLWDDNSVKPLLKNYTGFSLFRSIANNRAIITMNNNEVARFKVGLSLIKDQYHYIYRTNIVPNREELYNIQKDPKESKNLIDFVSKGHLKNLTSEFDRYPEIAPYRKKRVQ